MAKKNKKFTNQRKKRRIKKIAISTKSKRKKLGLRLKLVKPERQKKEKVSVPKTKIKIIGIGGGGNSIISEIVNSFTEGKERGDKIFRKVEFVALNTDLQALTKLSKNCKRLGFGKELTQGLGCGMDPELGEKAARGEKERIRKVLEGADFYILITCLGGGTGSGAAPVIAEICKTFKKSSLGIFTLPFKFEGEKKHLITKNSLKKMRPNLNAVNIIPNEKIFQIVDKSTPFKKALSAINQRLTFSLKGLIGMIRRPGLINIDWADFKTILGSTSPTVGRGKICYLNRVKTQGENRATIAAKKVVRNPLNEYGLEGADRILFNIEGNKDLKMQEVNEISKFISDFNRKAKIIFGISLLKPGASSSLRQKIDSGSEIGITLLATGTGKKPKRAKKERKGKAMLKIPLIQVESSKPEPKKRKGKKKIKSSKSYQIKKQGTKSEKDNKREVLLSDSKKKPAPFPTSPPLYRRAKEPPMNLEEKEIKKETKPPTYRKTTRKNALAIRKETEKVEKEILMEEKKWDLPAFLRKKQHG